MNSIKQYSNEEVIEKYLNHYRHSPESMRMRKSNLNNFFGENHFGFSGNILEISKGDLYDYFDYLNHDPNISLTTKENKWRIMSSFMAFCMEYYDDFMIVVPSKTICWKPTHKEANSNKDVIMDKQEVKKILAWLKDRNFKYYLIFRIFAETGMRKGELINIDYDNIDVEKRYIKTEGKRGVKVYYVSKELSELLEMYVEKRKDVKVETKALFLSTQLRRYSKRPFNRYLKDVLLQIGIEKNITCKSFRSTLNTMRKVMGCTREDRKILINHKTGDVNVEHYVKLNYEQFVELFDRWNPLKKMVL